MGFDRSRGVCVCVCVWSVGVNDSRRYMYLIVQGQVANQVDTCHINLDRSHARSTAATESPSHAYILAELARGSNQKRVSRPGQYVFELNIADALERCPSSETHMFTP
jgi:hypothetical protein